MIIDTATKALVGPPIPLSAGDAEQIAVTSDRTRAYLAVGDHVDVVDLLNRVVVTSFTIGTYPLDASDVVIAPNGARVYVTNRTSDTVSVIDADPESPTFNAVVATIPVGPFNTFQPFGMDITPDGTHLYVASGPT